MRQRPASLDATAVAVDARADRVPKGVSPPCSPESVEELVEQQRALVVTLSSDTPAKGGPAEWLRSNSDLSPMAGWHERLRRSLGSGVIIDAQGYVATTQHVLGSRDRVWLDYADGKRVRADVIGRDPVVDLALLKPRADGLSPLPIPRPAGDDPTPKVGQWLVLLANPFALGINATIGIVSADYRRALLMTDHGELSQIQTTLAIHAGNSGGAVFDLHGQLVGIATASERAPAAIGRVLPIALVRKILPVLQNKGTIDRGWAGFYIDRMTEERAFKAGLSQLHGALIREVVPGGPADKAGLRNNDVIVMFDDKQITSADQLPWIVATAGTRHNVPVEVWREGKKKVLTIRLQAIPR